MNSTKYCGNNIHVVYETLYNGEVRKRLYSVCRICGKDYVYNKRNKHNTCVECRRKLSNMNEENLSDDIYSKMSNYKTRIEKR